MIQNYYLNKLANENYVARPDSVWVADITEFELKKGKKVYVFFCLDIFSNVVITSVFRRRAITSSDIINKLNQAIDRRFPIKPKRKLIIHTDRGGQFTSKLYNDFIKLQEDFIDPSMSRVNKPKDNF